MSTLERLLREVLADVADEIRTPRPGEAPGGSGPRDLAAVAVAGARRQRRRRAGLALASAAAVVLVVAGAATVLPRTAPEPARPGPATRLELTDLALSGGARLTSYSTGGTSYVRRLGDRSFRALPYPAAVVSRRGAVAVSAAGPTTRVGFVDDLASGAVRWVELSVRVQDPVWSPDGSRLLATVVAPAPASRVDRRVGFVLVDPGTLRSTGVPVTPDEEVPRPLPLPRQSLGWDPSGRYVVGAVAVPDPVKYLWTARWWRLDGSPARTMPDSSGGGLAAPLMPVSPNGDRVAQIEVDGSIRIHDGIHQPPHSLVFDVGATGAAGWRDDDGLVVRVPGGFDLLDLAGRTRPYARWTGPGPYGAVSLTPA